MKSNERLFWVFILVMQGAIMFWMSTLIPVAPYVLIEVDFNGRVKAIENYSPYRVNVPEISRALYTPAKLAK